MHSRIRYGLLLAALVAFSACGSQSQEPRDTVSDKSKPAAPDQGATTNVAPPKPLSTDAEVRTGDRKEDKEPRANTPPGMDRSGGGPASGAIIDPAGVVTK